MRNLIMGIFEERGNADGAIDRLKGEGYDAKDISIIMKDDREAHEVAERNGTDVGRGAATGATAGAVVGGITGFLAGTALPALGGFIIGGPLGAALGLTGAAATTISGAATGVVAGGILGALIGLGLPRDKAQEYEHHLSNGAILVTVSALEEDTDDVRGILDEEGANDVTMVTEDERQHARNRDHQNMEKEAHRTHRMRFAHHHR